MENHEHVVVAGIRQGAGVTLAALQLHTGQDFRQVAPGFLDHASQVELAEWVGNFTAASTIIVATVNLEDILHGDGQGP